MKMYFKIIACLLLITDGRNAFPQDRPRLVVALVVDQMRWDFLFRYQDRYTEGGFKRLLREGFAFHNTYINYIPSMTAVGHASIFTGAVPAIHGIIGNEWPDRNENLTHYCTTDSATIQVGAGAGQLSMSPRNLKATTIGDELMLSNNFRSRIIAVSLKDRAAILPGGHKPTGAFWYDDKTGKMVTSSWYSNQLPGWVESFNKAGVGDKLMEKSWQTLYPIQTYKNSTADSVKWERLFKGSTASAFPHPVHEIYRNDKGILRNAPAGNTFIFSFAREAIKSNGLGKGSHTDMLTINCASTDYIGHQFGPNSVEIEDTYLRLDRDLEAFLRYLDHAVGKQNYLLLLTADHGGSHSINYLNSLNFPSGWLNGNQKQKALNALLEKKFGGKGLVKNIYNYQVYFNLPVIEKNGLNLKEVKHAAIQFLRKAEGVLFVADMENLSEASIPHEINQMLVNGYHARLSGQLVIIPESGWFDGPRQGTTHGTWNPTDTHIPLIFMGWKVRSGATDEKAAITDIAPTLAALLRIQAPNGSTGNVLKINLK
jgi:predicted AlkP superfamily pyrophosphatase or phosphodiesterase